MSDENIQERTRALYAQLTGRTSCLRRCMSPVKGIYRLIIR